MAHVTLQYLVVAEMQRRREYMFHSSFDLPALLSLCAGLEMFLRMPPDAGAGETVVWARSFIDDVIAVLRVDGLLAHAELIELGRRSPDVDGGAGAVCVRRKVLPC